MPGTKKIFGCRNKLRFFVSRLISERASVGPSLLIGQPITLQTFGACAGVLSRHARRQLCLFTLKPSQASGLLVTGFGQETERSWTNINNHTGHAPCFDGSILRIDVLSLREFAQVFIGVIACPESSKSLLPHEGTGISWITSG